MVGVAEYAGGMIFLHTMIFLHVNEDENFPQII